MAQLLLASLHEDVTVVASFRKVNELYNVGVIDLLPNNHLRLNSLYYVHFQLLLRSLISLLLRNLNQLTPTCLSSSTFDIILQANGTPELPLGQAA